MSKGSKILLILIAVVCFGVALSYPIRYELETRSNAQTMDRLTELRKAGLENAAKEKAQQASEEQESTVTTDETNDAEAEAVPEPGTAPQAPEANEGDAQPQADEGASNRTPAPASGAHGTGEIDANRTIAPAPASDAQSVNAQATAAPAANAQTADTQTADAQATAAPAANAQTADTQTTDAQEAASQEISSQAAPSEEAVQAQPTAAPETAGDKADAVSPSAVGEGAAIAVPTAAAQEGTTGTAASSAPTATPSPVPTPVPTPTPDRTIRTGVLPYPLKEKIELDESKILPQYRELYALNNDLVGWITIQGTYIDYPVVQNEDNEYYLRRDFFGEDNKNGQIILDTLCDPYTPSYNLIISGHNMRNESMFSTLVNYFRYKEDWAKHKFVQFDSLMQERTYVVLAAFFAVDYAIWDDGFRYNADIQYKVDLDLWLDEVRSYQLYNTGIDAEFGDEFLTLTTCNSQRRKNGRFVVICRKLREGETIE